jgi:hypothetical protein
LGLTVTSAAVSLNDNSNFATNINTGSSTGTVTIGGTGTQTLSIGNGAGVKLLTSEVTIQQAVQHYYQEQEVHCL